MSDEKTTQTCSCPCGASSFEVNAPPILRFYCHCKICQKLYQQPFADATVLKLSDVVLPESNNIEFNKYKKIAAIERGTCSQCHKPVIAIAGSGDKGLAFVAAQNFSDKGILPDAKMHVFYGSRAADVSDDLPKYKGYLRSQFAVIRSMSATAPKA
ncbi:MAG: GFA family protein [Halioglobus sp.]